MSNAAAAFEKLNGLIGNDSATGDWFEITQDQINDFADCTHDHQFIHVDPERATRDGPAGGPIAHGFFTLSMLSYFAYETELWPEGTAYGMNYGLNKVRFIAPMPIGKRVRMRFVLKGFEPHSSGGFLMTNECTAEVEGQARPAMVAEWLGIFFPKESDAA